GRLRRARARARVEAEPGTEPRRAARRAGQSGHRRARPVPSRPRRGRRGPARPRGLTRGRSRRRRAGGTARRRRCRRAPPSRCDGARALALPLAQDFKRIGEGDTGPNTGGMGSYSPVAGFGTAETEELLDTIHRPVLEELAARGTPFVGMLFAGVMMTADGPRV